MPKSKKKAKSSGGLPSNINDGPSANSRQILTAKSVTFSGPIPPPEVLAQYDAIIAGGAERIIAMAESQSVHRQSLEKWAVKGGTVLSFAGVAAALLISLCVLWFSYMLLTAGHPINGTILSGIGLGSLVYSFIYGTRTRKEERLRKDQNSKIPRR